MHPDVTAAAIDGRWLRFVPHAADPLGRAPNPDDGRWQRSSVVSGLYLAADEATATVEWYRGLAERGQHPDEAIPYDLHAWDADLRAADLSTPDRLADVGLVPPAPGRFTWPPYQDVGEALAAAGWAAVLAPSAALPAGTILCVFTTTS